MTSPARTAPQATADPRTTAADLRTAAILPVKSFPHAKQRLAATVAGPLRAELARAMVLDVLDALARTPDIAQTIVVTNEPVVATAARAHDALVLADSAERGQSAAAGIGLARALAEGFQRALCVPGDCPTLDPEELGALLDRPGAPLDRPGAPLDKPGEIPPGLEETSQKRGARAGARAGARGRVRVRARGADLEKDLLGEVTVVTQNEVVIVQSEVVIVPDRHGTGTNALLLSPPDAIAPAFGPGSCARHIDLARTAGVAVRVERLSSLLLDIDTGEDLAVLRTRLAGERTWAPRTRAALGLGDATTQTPPMARAG